MCQIHIINKTNFLNNPTAYEDHLNSGARINDHGSAALFIDDEGNHSIIRAMKFETIMDMLHMNDRWETVVIHQRYTTQGAANLSNTHLWQVGNYFYCHNGVLRDEDTNKYEVDSQLIGHYLETNPWEAIAYCQSEDYANTFIVGLDEKKIWVTRSKTNTLYTDGNGQYSTRLLKGEIDTKMPENSVEIINLDIEVFEKWGQYNYDKFGSYNYTPRTGSTKTYEQKVADATHGKTEDTKPDEAWEWGDSPADDTEFDPADEFSDMEDTEVKYSVESLTAANVVEIEKEMDAGLSPSLDDVIEIEQALHDAIANEDKTAERKYNYLLEKANGNG